jgi:hypothetical protein
MIDTQKPYMGLKSPNHSYSKDSALEQTSRNQRNCKPTLDIVQTGLKSWQSLVASTEICHFYSCHISHTAQRDV